MTGVEKVREWATIVLGARYGRTNLLEVHSRQQWQDVIGKYCLAYGAHLRGLIEMGTWWCRQVGIEYNREFAIDDCRKVIAAWKEVVNADQASTDHDRP